MFLQFDKKIILKKINLLIFIKTIIQKNFVLRDVLKIKVYLKIYLILGIFVSKLLYFPKISKNFLLSNNFRVDISLQTSSIFF